MACGCQSYPAPLRLLRFSSWRLCPRPVAPKETEFYLYGYAATDGIPTNQLAEIPWENVNVRPVVMTQWSSGKYVANWTEVILKIKEYPVPRPTPDMPNSATSSRQAESQHIGAFFSEFRLGRPSRLSGQVGLVAGYHGSRVERGFDGFDAPEEAGRKRGVQEKVRAPEG